MHACIYPYIHTDTQTYRPTEMQTCRHAYIQTCIHPDIQTYRQTYRHTDIHTLIHSYIHTFILLKTLICPPTQASPTRFKAVSINVTHKGIDLDRIGTNWIDWIDRESELDT